MKCAHDDCQNDARYVDQHGKLVCGTCPIKRGEDSIRVADVPALLAWAREFVHFMDASDAPDQRLAAATRLMRDIIGRSPT